MSVCIPREQHRDNVGTHAALLNTIINFSQNTETQNQLWSNAVKVLYLLYLLLD